MGARAKELCEAAGGRLVQKNGRSYCALPVGTSDAVKMRLGETLQAKAIIRHYDLANPPQRPIGVRRQNFFHILALTAVTSQDYFLALPATYLIDGDFDNQGIREDMELLGVRALIRPQSFQDVDSTYCTVSNTFTSGGWELMVNRRPVAHDLILNIAPSIKWEPGAVGGTFTTSLIPADFYWFRRELGIRLDKLVIKNTDIVSVRATFPEPLTTKSGMKVGFQIAVRVAKEEVLL